MKNKYRCDFLKKKKKNIKTIIIISSQCIPLICGLTSPKTVGFLVLGLKSCSIIFVVDFINGEISSKLS